MTTVDDGDWVMALAQVHELCGRKTKQGAWLPISVCALRLAVLKHGAEVPAPQELAHRLLLTTHVRDLQELAILPAQKKQNAMRALTNLVESVVVRKYLCSITGHVPDLQELTQSQLLVFAPGTTKAMEDFASFASLLDKRTKRENVIHACRAAGGTI
jgi:hypothetical protein